MSVTKLRVIFGRDLSVARVRLNLLGYEMPRAANTFHLGFVILKVLTL